MSHRRAPRVQRRGRGGAVVRRHAVPGDASRLRRDPAALPVHARRALPGAARRLRGNAIALPVHARRAVRCGVEAPVVQKQTRVAADNQRL